MKKEFVTYTQALVLKELGFDPFLRENCLAYFNTSNSNNDLETKDWWCLPKNDFQYALSAPLKQQIFRWCRDEHGLNHCIDLNFRINSYKVEIWKDRECLLDKSCILTYEEAESTCIDKLIEIISINNNLKIEI